MKTSHYLLLAAAVISLTGLVTHDLLLKQEYDKIDWTDEHQFFARRNLPPARHLVITGTADRNILIEQSSQSQALISPNDSLSFQSRTQGDTLFITFSPDVQQYNGSRGKVHFDEQANSPRGKSWFNSPTGLLLRLPGVQNLRIIDARVTLENQTFPTLNVTLQNSLLYANQLTVSGALQLTERKNSLAVLTKGSYQTARVTVDDESAIHFNDTRMDAFSPNLSNRAEVLFKGQTTRWVK